MKWIVPAVVTAVALLLWPWLSELSIAGEIESQVCDVDADYYLGLEDYPDAIRLHIEVVRKHPNDAIAHYHLGFAMGIVGDLRSEVREYQRAEELGLGSWDLFLNLGLAQLEGGDLNAAAGSLQCAVLLGEDHSEPHYDLALVDEERGMLAEAEQETMAALRLNPEQPDARNLLGVIYAREGNTVGASLLWRDLMRELPDYEPARTNLAILGSTSRAAIGETTAVSLPRAAAVNAFSK